MWIILAIVVEIILLTAAFLAGAKHARWVDAKKRAVLDDYNAIKEAAGKVF